MRTVMRTVMLTSIPASLTCSRHDFHPQIITAITPAKTIPNVSERCGALINKKEPRFQ